VELADGTPESRPARPGTVAEDEAAMEDMVVASAETAVTEATAVLGEKEDTEATEVDMAVTVAMEETLPHAA